MRRREEEEENPVLVVAVYDVARNQKAFQQREEEEEQTREEERLQREKERDYLAPFLGRLVGHCGTLNQEQIATVTEVRPRSPLTYLPLTSSPLTLSPLTTPPFINFQPPSFPPLPAGVPERHATESGGEGQPDSGEVRCGNGIPLSQAGLVQGQPELPHSRQRSRLHLILQRGTLQDTHPGAETQHVS